jgi:catechol 2,3-dioxygenase-like lactoylglutathione lyase family enzyme
MTRRSFVWAGVGLIIAGVWFFRQTPGQAQGQGSPALEVRHVHIRVNDVDRTKAFYRDKLGLKVSNETPGTVVEFEGGKLWFGKWRGAGAMAASPGITIGLHAPSVEAAYQMLKSRGVNLPNPPAPARDEFEFTFKDPDGYEIAIEGPK